MVVKRKPGNFGRDLPSIATPLAPSRAWLLQGHELLAPGYAPRAAGGNPRAGTCPYPPVRRRAAISVPTNQAAPAYTAIAAAATSIIAAAS